MSKTLLLNIFKECLPATTSSDRSVIADRIFDSFTHELSVTGHLALPGTGSLRLQTRAARPGRNPATGEPLVIPSKTVARFTPSKRLEAVINDSGASVSNFGEADPAGEEPATAKRAGRLTTA